MCAWAKQHRGDFLTLPFRGSTSAWWSGRKYYQAPPMIRAQYRAEIKKRGYTRIYFDLFGQWGKKESYFEHPTDLVPFLKESVADGLGTVVFLGPEDDKPAQAKWKKGKRPWDAYLAQLKIFMKICGPHIAECVLGVEVEEYWPDYAVERIGAALRTMFQGPIWVHRSTGAHGAWGWWKAQRWATGLAYQFTKRDKSNGFLAHPTDVRTETTLYAGRLKTHGGGKAFLAGEYAYRRPEAKARALGKVAMAAGATGFMNGG